MSKSNTRARADGLFTGNVGIGVTPEAWSGTVYALQLGEDTALYNDSGYTILANNAYLSGGNKYLSTGAASRHYQVSGTHKFEVAPSGSADAAISFTTAMTIDNAGRVTKPNQPHFHVGKSNGDVSAGNVVAFNVVRFNIGSHYNASNGRFTAPVTGAYQFNLHLINKSNFNTSIAQLKINGANTIDVHDNQTNGAHAGMGTSAVMRLSVGDYIEVHSHGTTIYGTGASHTYFSGFLIG
jgi:hypothetical protein